MQSATGTSASGVGGYCASSPRYSFTAAAGIEATHSNTTASATRPPAIRRRPRRSSDSATNNKMMATLSGITNTGRIFDR